MAKKPKVKGMEPVPIHTEDEAWELLTQLQSTDFTDETKLPIITKWPKFHVKFWFEGKSLVLTQPVMQAMIDYQTSVNRAFMLVIENTSELKGLSEEERKEFEILFTVTRGSTDLSINAQDIIEKFMEKAVGRLTGKQITIIVLAFALLFAGYSSYNVYLENQKEIAKTEASNVQLKTILDSHNFASKVDLERMKLLRDALTTTHSGPAMAEASEESKKSLLKAAARVEGTQVGGNYIPPEVAQRMSRNARTNPSIKVVTSQYLVIRVDSDVADGFRVRLENSKTGERVFASVRDHLLSEGDRNLIKEGEWAKKPIVARVKETRRRGELVSAHIEQVISVIGGTSATLQDQRPADGHKTI